MDVNQQPERNYLNTSSISSGNSANLVNESSSPQNQHSNIEEGFFFYFLFYNLEYQSILK
jgi:hypothetical protein